MKEANKNLKKANIRLKIFQLDWRNLATKIPEEVFDAVLCLGNSLTCLFKQKDQLVALKEFYSILKKGGILIIDERNYQNILDNRIKILEEKFYYSKKYLYCGRYVHSRPVEIKKDKIKFEVYDQRTKKGANFAVYPFKQNELKGLLKAAGFRRIWQYSDYRLKYNSKADFYFYVCRK